MDGSMISTAQVPASVTEAEIVRLSDAIMAGHEEGNRLSLLEDGLGDTPANRQQKKRIRVQQEHLTRDGWDMRAQLATLQATTFAGWQAKARVVREFNNCGEGCGTGYDDDAMGYSLASDLLGLPCEFKEEDSEQAETEIHVERAPQDPWPADTGAPPFREQFPLMEAPPADLPAFLAQAEADFTVLGKLAALQRESMATIQRLQQEQPAAQAALFDIIKEMHDRYEKVHLALRGELIRVGAAIYRADIERGIEPTSV